MLESAGFEVVTAVDGMEALERLRDGVFSAVITDLEMPAMDGFELTRRIRSHPRLQHLPIIALSARGSSSFRDRAREAGVDHYETKLDSDRLRKAMETALTSSQQHLLPPAPAV